MTITVLVAEEFAPSPAQEAAWIAELPKARRVQLEAWPDAGARRRSLLASRLLREGLQRLGYQAHSLAGLRYTQHGKPMVDLPVDFSLSHCAGRALCALTTAGRVGVDVERLDASTAAAFKIYLSPSERAWAGDDPRRFYALWTRKEAVVKAAGARGLAQLRDVRIDRDGATFAGTHWHTAPVPSPLLRGFSAHVAFAASPAALAVHWVGKEELSADSCNMADARFPQPTTSH
jgi:4'-phosphopantetheinyl transferase